MKLYTLDKGDREILRLALKDPNYASDYYIRSADSGTWFLPGAVTQRWREGYEKLYVVWRHKGKPDEFEFGNVKYRARWDHEKAKDYPNEPAFHRNHGALFLPYHKMLHLDRTPTRVVIGGFGSGKTLGSVFSLLVHAITLPSFRAFWFAPELKQVEEFMALIMQYITGTPYYEKFYLGHKMAPRPKIEIGHSEVGVCSIEGFPLLNRESSFRTLTGDMAIIDQAEHQAINLEETLRTIGTRFRGRVAKNARNRVGTITLLANAEDNQYLWDLYDMAKEDPKNYLALSPSSYDNIWLTDKDLADFELRVGKSEEAKRQWLFGERPLGNGQHFSRAMLEWMRDESLDRIMEENKDEPGFVKIETPNAGVTEFLLPPLDGHEYLVMSDPGNKNPPERDSGVIMIWDITDFPGKKSQPKPATMIGFIWVQGNNNIMNWANRYAEVVRLYGAYTTNGFDATGFQSGYDQWLNILEGLMPEKMVFNQHIKSAMLNAAKVLMANRMFRAPKCLTGMYGQLARYVYPHEPKNLRQDIVMCLIMSAYWMMRRYYNMPDDTVPPYTEYAQYKQVRQRSEVLRKR